MTDEHMSIDELRSAYQRLIQRVNHLERQERDLAQHEATTEHRVLQTEERVTAATGLQEEAVFMAKVTFVAEALSGTALNWFMGWLTALPDFPTTVPSWGQFLTAIRQRFADIDNGQYLRTCLRNLRQTSSVSAYTEEFNSIVSKITDMGPADILHYYLMGLKRPIYRDVKAARLTMLAEAQNHALEMDGVFASSQGAPIERRPMRPTSTTSSSTSTTPAPMELGTLGRLTPQERERCRREKLCYRCRQPGHLASQCPRFGRANALHSEQGNALPLDETQGATQRQ
ncbi:hypothetical protein H4R35_003815 [Dimargaris xerosporica]|nr:hypothetical protein H4R35_003815 [Dimargaris xerosporica]